jgi:hypothetical protein
MPFVSFGVFEIKLFGSIGTCCDYLSVRLIHFPQFLLLAPETQQNTQNCSERRENQRRNWNIKLTSHEKKTSTATYSCHESEPKRFSYDENQYLIMQLSIRKLLSVCLLCSFAVLTTGHTVSRVRQTRQWIGIPGCCFLIYGPKIIIRSNPQ